MSKQAMNYIIEKMRGDSLTPLGLDNGKSSAIVTSPEKDITTCFWYGTDIQKNIKNNMKDRAMRFLSGHISKDNPYTVNYGKWELVVDSDKFHNHGFYYKTKLPDGIKLYLFYILSHSYTTLFGSISLRIGCALTSSITSIYRDTEILGAGDTIESVDAYLKKIFGIRTFIDDCKKYNK